MDGKSRKRTDNLEWLQTNVSQKHLNTGNRQSCARTTSYPLKYMHEYTSYINFGHGRKALTSSLPTLDMEEKLSPVLYTL